jgi:hypothetical protein
VDKWAEGREGYTASRLAVRSFWKERMGQARGQESKAVSQSWKWEGMALPPGDPGLCLGTYVAVINRVAPGRGWMEDGTLLSPGCHPSLSQPRMFQA